MVFYFTIRIRNAPVHVDDDDLIDENDETRKVDRVLCATQQHAERVVYRTIRDLFCIHQPQLEKSVGWCTEYSWQHPKHKHMCISADVGELPEVHLTPGHDTVTLP